MRVTPEEALAYHRNGRHGKIEVVPTKPTLTQRDLSLAYTPGVAVPVMEIARDGELAYDYTSKGNLVAVVSNGSAILGLGDQGAAAAKPVMEGKGVLFKRFADVDVFDLELDTRDPDEIIRTVQVLAPTFGGINLEDIKAPECFHIEETLKKWLDIPVFHDDQHGTAIISGAALLNALELTQRTIAEARIVISGAGAAAIACAAFYVLLGARQENITMVDTVGVIYQGRRERMNPYKARYAIATADRTLADAVRGRDVFIGLSAADVLTPAMVQTMAAQPIIFAMANPDPEINYDLAKEARPDAIVATGRSDYPNQVNNVLGFPFIFRGALDVRASAINDAMKVAAARALSALAKEDVPDSVLTAYGLEALRYGPEYIIPKPVDPRVLLWVAPAVAEAAMQSGVARKPVDVARYREQLEARLGKGWEIMRTIIHKARRSPRRVVFAEGEERKIIRAAAQVAEEGIGHPILLGRPAIIRERVAELGLAYQPVAVEPERSERLAAYAEALYQRRQRQGVTHAIACALAKQPNYFGALMVEMGDADAFVSGLTYDYPAVIRPALQIVHTRPGVQRVAGVYIMIVRDRVLFFADATVNIEPTADDLAEIAVLVAELATEFDIQPRIAMLSFSNFGSAPHPLSEKVRQAVELVRQRAPHLIVDGEMQADTAVVDSILAERYPFSPLRDANILIFPDLEAANVAYKLLARLGHAEAIGPILLGTGKPIQVLQTGDEVKDIVRIAAMAVVDAQAHGR